MIPRLGVNIDHVATVRNARGTPYPDPLVAAKIALDAGAYGITAHLREDRRHILDQDVLSLRDVVKGKKFNLEMALTEEMVKIAKRVKPDYVCLVPERRAEKTTEGGLSLDELRTKRKWIHDLQQSHIKVSLFLSPELKSVQQIIELTRPDAIELHTGEYAHAYEEAGAVDELRALDDCGKAIQDAKLECHAGHGLNLDNLEPLCSLHLFEEYNIGHAIVAQSIFESLETVVKKYLEILKDFPIS